MMESLTKKWHGVPIWAWVAGGLLVAYVGYRRFSNRSSSSSSQSGMTANPLNDSPLTGGGSSAPPPFTGVTQAVDPNTGNVMESMGVDTSGAIPDGSQQTVTPLDPFQWYGPNSGAAVGGPSPLYAYSSGQEVGESPGLGSVFSPSAPASQGYAALGFQPSDNITFVPTQITPGNAAPVPVPIKGTRVSVV